MWEVKDDNTKTLACEPIRGNNTKGNENHIVLDVQFRLIRLFCPIYFIPTKYD